MPVPRDISTHRPALGDAELTAVAAVFESRWLGQGEVTRAFEQALIDRLGVRHVVAVSSGTAALHLALEAMRLPEGSGVLVPSLTFTATVQAILAARLQPVFCEVDAATLQLDLDDVARRLRPRDEHASASGRPRVVLPVHFGGAACDMAALTTLADAFDLLVVEDAAHAFGSTLDGRALGTFGDAGCFSFDPIKNITCGEGGAVATANDTLADRLRGARSLGIRADGWSRHAGGAAWRYEVDGQGWRCHLPNLNAAIGLAQLARADGFRARKQAIVHRYHEAFAGAPGLTPVTQPASDVFPFTYTVRVADGRRDQLMAALRAARIGASVEYIPNHLQPAFAAWRTALPVTERLFDEILSLPLHAELTDEDVARVIEAVHRFLVAGGAPCTNHAHS